MRRRVVWLGLALALLVATLLLSRAGNDRAEPLPIDSRAAANPGLDAFERGGHGSPSVAAERDVSQNVVAHSGDERVHVTRVRPGIVEGIVVDAGGAPVRGARITVNWAGAEPKSSAGGSFRVTNVQPGTIALNAWLMVEGVEHGAAARVTVPAGGHVRNVQLRLEPIPSRALARRRRSGLLVHVVDVDGEPTTVPRVQSETYARGRPDPSTGRLGSYRLKLREPPGTSVRVWAYPRAANSPTAIPTAVSAVTGDLDSPPAVTLRLSAGIVIDVTLHTSADEPVPTGAGPRVRLIGKQAVPLDSPRQRSQPARWRFRVHPGARCTLIAEARGFARIHRRDWNAPSEPGTVIIRFRAGAEIRGQIAYPDNRPVGIGEATVEAFRMGTGAWSGSSGTVSVAETASDAAGRFRLRGLSSGTFRLTIRARRDDQEHVTTVTLRGSEIRELGVCVLGRPTQLVGRVVDEADAPIGGARIRPFVDAFVTRGTSSHGDGRFRVHFPSAADGHLLVTKPGYGTRVVAITSGSRSGVSIVLPRPSTLRVVVEGKMRRSGWFGVGSPDGRVTWQQRGTTHHRDKFGDLRGDPAIYTVPDLAPGPIRVIARLDRREGSRVVSVVAGETIEVRLRPR